MWTLPFCKTGIEWNSALGYYRLFCILWPFLQKITWKSQQFGKWPLGVLKTACGVPVLLEQLRRESCLPLPAWAQCRPRTGCVLWGRRKTTGTSRKEKTKRGASHQIQEAEFSFQAQQKIICWHKGKRRLFKRKEQNLESPQLSIHVSKIHPKLPDV